MLDTTRRRARRIKEGTDPDKGLPPFYRSEASYTLQGFHEIPSGLGGGRIRGYGSWRHKVQVVGPSNSIIIGVAVVAAPALEIHPEKRKKFTIVTRRVLLR